MEVGRLSALGSHDDDRAFMDDALALPARAGLGHDVPDITAVQTVVVAGGGKLLIGLVLRVVQELTLLQLKVLRWKLLDQLLVPVDFAGTVLHRTLLFGDGLEELFNLLAR